LYQGSTSTESGDAWITEGGAEAFAAIALRADASAYVQSTEEKAVGKCQEFLKGRSVRDAIAAGTYDAAYSCGMLINLAIDSKVRLATKHDGLYAVWRNYLRRARNKESVVSTAAYLEAVADVGGADIAEWVQKAVADQGATMILGR
jgi:predicted metalloprotease with PDZ domain